MKTLSYKVGELKMVIKESTNEFKEKLGPNVRRDNEKNNRETEKRAKDFDGGLKEPKKREIPPRNDGNATMFDLNPRTEPTERYKKDQEDRMNGYTSSLEAKNGIKKAGATFDDGKLRKNFEDARDARNKEREDLASSGLVGRVLADKDKNKFKRNNLTENMKAKRLIFKNTRFINESQMLDRIPEEYKVDGQKIYMKDGYERVHR